MKRCGSSAGSACARALDAAGDDCAEERKVLGSIAKASSGDPSGTFLGIRAGHEKASNAGTSFPSMEVIDMAGELSEKSSSECGGSDGGGEE